jgi:hypothetical protein
MAISLRIDSAPKIDGDLREDFWLRGKNHILAGVNAKLEGAYGVDYMVRHDDKNVYLAVTCKIPAGVERAKIAEKRERDGNLAESDRIEFFIDLDRDYGTYYRFAIDERGMFADDCWGDSTWNPRWYCAVAHTDSGWQAEIAIPVESLAAGADLANEPWAFNIQRIIPAVGTLGWTLPVGVEPKPEGFTMLKFHAKNEKNNVVKPEMQAGEDQKGRRRLSPRQGSQVGN